ncbi:MAG: thymidylate kinase, partial [Oscillospiraceae bacterium]
MSGKFIVIEGLDGSGKATQTALLFDSIDKSGEKIKQISFPNYADPSSSLVKMYLRGDFGKNSSDTNCYAASSFYSVDRYASYHKYWKDDYEKGTIILAD